MSNIKSLLNRINKSQDEWFALHMATWHYADCIKKEYSKEDYAAVSLTSGTSFVVAVSRDVSMDNTVVTLGLPASKREYHKFNLKELYSILTSYDGRLTLNHLIIIFALFESFLSVVAKEIYQKDIDTGKFYGIKEFFKISDFSNLQKTNPNLINELCLAKETRNCFTHNDSKIDPKWIKSYEDARGKTSCSDGDKLESGLPDTFQQVETWHVLIVDMANQIYRIISAKPVGTGLIL